MVYRLTLSLAAEAGLTLNMFYSRPNSQNRAAHPAGRSPDQLQLGLGALLSSDSLFHQQIIISEFETNFL
jgi:hypothetical protein